MTAPNSELAESVIVVHKGETNEELEPCAVVEKQLIMQENMSASHE